MKNKKGRVNIIMKKENHNFRKKAYNEKEKKKNPKKEERSFEDIIEGRNAVLELLESGKDINKIFIQNGEKSVSRLLYCIFRTIT